MRKLITILILFTTLINAQDSTRSEAFKDNFVVKPPVVRAKYPSYTLLNGYLLVQEANKKDPFAQHELGIRYLLGRGFAADTVKAIYWIRKAADQNLPYARFNYGIMLYNGIGVPWNPFEAFQNFKIAADYGLSEALYAVGLVYTENFVVNRNFNRAYQFFVKSSKLKYEAADDAIKQLLKSGFVPTLDYDDVKNNPSFESVNEKSQPLFSNDFDLDYLDFDSTKAEKESIEKIFSMSKKSAIAFLGIEEDTLRDTTKIGIKDLLDLASESGSPEALLYKGKAVEKGLNYKKDNLSALVNYLRALRIGAFNAYENILRILEDKNIFVELKNEVNKNNPDAMYAWASLTALGLDNQLPADEAISLLNKAVAINHIPSMIELGLIYYSGQLGKQDKEKAFDIWNSAASFGSVEAKVRISLATILEDKKSDYTSEVQALQDAFNNGSVFAQTALAYCYEKGIGVQEDKSYSVKLYKSASQRGSQQAFNSLRRMYDEIRPDEKEFKLLDQKL